MNADKGKRKWKREIGKWQNLGVIEWGRRTKGDGVRLNRPRRTDNSWPPGGVQEFFCWARRARGKGRGRATGIAGDIWCGGDADALLAARCGAVSDGIGFSDRDTGGESCWVLVAGRDWRIWADAPDDSAGVENWNYCGIFRGVHYIFDI